MTDDEIAQLLTDAESYLKQTTLGYLQKRPIYWENTTTNWYQGLNRIEGAIAALKTRHKILITLVGKAQVGSTLTATVTLT